jgi:hypothetical protein
MSKASKSVAALRIFSMLSFEPGEREAREGEPGEGAAKVGDAAGSIGDKAGTDDTAIS